MELDAKRFRSLVRMVDEGVVSFSVGAGVVAAIPLCAIQGNRLVEWSPILFVTTWILAFLAAYPFVCALLNACYLLASPCDASKAAAGMRMEAATIVAGVFGALCTVLLASSARASEPAGKLAIAALGMAVCLFWYVAARFLPKSAEASSSAMAALALLLAASTVFGLVGTAGFSPVWTVLVLLCPFNLLLILAKLVRKRLHARR